MEAIALGVYELPMSPLAVGGFEEIVWVVLLWGTRSRWKSKKIKGPREALGAHMCVRCGYYYGGVVGFVWGMCC